MITTKDKRVQERGAWQELQLIIKRYRALGNKLAFSIYSKRLYVSAHMIRTILYTYLAHTKCVYIRFNFIYVFI